MTSLQSIAIALSLIVNDVTLLLEGHFLDHKNLAALFVYLISISLLVGQLNLFPFSFWRKCSILCLLLEIPVAFCILELSLRYIWKHIQDYISTNADAFLVQLSDDAGLEWMVCYLCCGKPNCPGILTDLMLKLLSFSLLAITCSLVNVKGKATECLCCMS